MADRKSVVDNINAYYEQLFSAEKKVADYILQNLQETVMMNVSELANHSGVSEATVVRMCKHAGYQGYHQMRLILAHDMGKDASANSSNEMVDSAQRLFEQCSSNVAALGERIDMETLIKCVKLIKKSRLVHIVGAGNTAPVAMDLGFRLERFGIPCTYGVLPEHFLNHVSLGQREDLLIAISRSGTSKQTVQAMELAQRAGMKSIVVTSAEYSPLSKYADYVLLTKYKDDLFPPGNGGDSHVCELVINDALLYVTRHWDMVTKEFVAEQGDTHTDEMELLLAEYKL